MLESVLDDYGVKGEIVSVRPGPVVTMYELEPAPGLKASRVIGLADDIARSMSALSARVSTVPGRIVIGIELPNQHREKVVAARDPGHRDFGDGTHRLPLALGKDIGGDPDHREPGQDAPPADRGDHRFGQVGGDQHDDPVACSTS
jgi:S-DNA-T family DNA segregation ATPase FtsK/SpoIIIE